MATWTSCPEGCLSRAAMEVGEVGFKVFVSDVKMEEEMRQENTH